MSYPFFTAKASIISLNRKICKHFLLLSIFYAEINYFFSNKASSIKSWIKL